MYKFLRAAGYLITFIEKTVAIINALCTEARVATFLVEITAAETGGKYLFAELSTTRRTPPRHLLVLFHAKRKARLLSPITAFPTLAKRLIVE